MRFAEQHFILFFALAAALCLFYLWAFSVRRKALERFAHKELLAGLLDATDPARKKLKVLLMAVAIVLLLLALLRPQWGFHWQEVKRQGLDIVIALDTSKSMLASDVKPNRLERSRLALKDLVGHLNGDRIALVAFAGTAFLQCPLTVDYNGFLLSLEDVTTATIPRGGTSLAGAIQEARKAFEGGINKYKVLIIITDGEDHEGDPLRAAEEAKKEGIMVFCIGIGTKEGEIISVPKEDGGSEYVKDARGNVIKSRLDEQALEKIALATGGSYIRSTSTEFGLEFLYKEKLSKMEKREFASKLSKLYEERFQFPLAAAIVLLLLEASITERKGPLSKER